MDLASTALADFLKAASAATPTPGGGAISAVAAAVGSSMALMAANFTAGKKRFRAVEPEVKQIIATLERLQNNFLELAGRDMAAYAALGEAFKLPRDTAEQQAQRDQAVIAAARLAIQPPAGIVEAALAALEAAARLAVIGNPNLKSDVAVAAVLLQAAAHAAAMNVRINLPLLPHAEAAAFATAADQRVAKAEALKRQVLEATGM